MLTFKFTELCDKEMLFVDFVHISERKKADNPYKRMCNSAKPRA